MVGPLRLLSRAVPDEGPRDRLRHASGWGRVGALIGPSVVPIVVISYGVEAVFTLGAISFAIAALNVLLLGPKPRGASSKR